MYTRAELFPDLKAKAYLNHASLSAINQRSADAMTRLLQDYKETGLDAWPKGLAIRNSLREDLAQLIGSQASEIALTLNTSHGLSLIANEYPFQKGDGLVLVRGEFPGNIVPWLNVAERMGLEVHWLDVEDLIEQNQNLFKVMEQQPKLLAVSWVQYQTGKAISLESLSHIRETYGVHICLDAIQGLGPLTMNLQETPLDFVTVGGHKWLLAVEGTGFLYVHPERMPEMVPSQVGWISKEEPFDFLTKGPGLVDYNAPLKQDTSRYEIATMNSLGFAALGASIKLLLEVGPQKVSQRVLELADYCRKGLKAIGLEPVESTAGNVSVPFSAERLTTLYKACRDAGVVVSTPDGHLRCSPHFYNTEAEIDCYLNVLKDLV